MMTHARIHAIVSVAIVAATLLLSGCSPSSTPAVPPGDGATPVFEHIHELVVDPDGGDLLVATHVGLYRLVIRSNGEAVAGGPVGGLDFDPMGFAVVNGTIYASGHPGPTTPGTFGSPNLGLITSTDAGETWTNVSLTGETDFHSLTAAIGDGGVTNVFGFDGAAGRIQRSFDGGETWVAGASLSAGDVLAIGSRLYATTAEGLAVSTDNGATFAVEAASPLLAALAVDSGGMMVGIDLTGSLWTSSPDQEWVRGGAITGTPQAVAIDGTRIYVADDRGIAITDDIGTTWTVLAMRF